jgi:hypothetical protein
MERWERYWKVAPRLNPSEGSDKFFDGETGLPKNIPERADNNEAMGWDRHSPLAFGHWTWEPFWRTGSRPSR